MSRKVDQRLQIPSLPPEKAESVLAQLERILASQQFRGSRRCQNLLRHIVQQTVAGETAQLKERTLGIEVFERAVDYDTSQDPVVRATAGEIRKKLAQYYQEPGHETEPRIELLAGSYIAEFPEPGPVPQAEAVHETRRLRPVLAGIGVITAAVALIAGGLALRGKTSDLQQLWTPVLNAPGTIIISLGQPIVYNLRSSRAQDRLQGIGASASVTLPEDGPPISREDLVVLPDRYLAMGDVICLVRLTSMLEKAGKSYRIRGERSTTFSDLRETPSVLIGAFDNQWTLQAGGKLRFTFAKDVASDTDYVRDRDHLNNREWKLSGEWPYWDVNSDYAIVSRIIDTTTDRPQIIAAGITHYGTMASGEFLTNSVYFAEAAGQLPRGWEKKNLQFVLRVPVVNRTAGHPQVLAVHVW